MFETRRGAPFYRDYEDRELIAEQDRCERCEGLGVIQFLNIDFSLNPDEDKEWIICYNCYGTGRRK